MATSIATEVKPRTMTPFYIGWGALALLCASLPYIYGALTTPSGHVYTGLTYNIDDVCVYLSSIRQAMNGSLFQRNLFTTEPQTGHVVNLLFLILGNAARATGLSPVAVYHVARVGFGGLLLWAVAGLLRDTLASERARRLAFLLVCFGAGIGWLWGGYDPGRAFEMPVDLWQPEANTFLSLYYTPLFVAASALIVVFVRAALRVEQTGQWGAAWPAAVSGFLLGNFHTYDVVHVFAVWAVFRAVSDVESRKLDRRRWIGFVVALASTLPTTFYTYVSLLRDPIFAGRDTGTGSPSFRWLASGFGLLMFFAVVAFVQEIRRPTNAESPFATAAFRLLAIWAIVGLILPYIPLGFQRKLIMGVHFPLCLMSGVALAQLTARLSGDFPKIASAFAVLLTVPSCALFLLQDVGRLGINVGSTSLRPYLTQNEADALSWIRQNTQPGEVVFVSPDPASHRRFPFQALPPYLSTYIPAFAGRAVYNGHWSETVNYARKYGETLSFFRADTPNDVRSAFLQKNNIHYVLYANALADGLLTDAQNNPIDTGSGPYLPVAWAARPNNSPVPLPIFLKPVYANDEVTWYAVRPQQSGFVP